MTKAHSIQIDENTEIEKLILDNVTQKFNNCDETDLLLNNGQIKNLIIR